MNPITLTVTVPSAAAATSICLSQAVAAAGALTINGSFATAGVATLDTPRRVAVVSASASDTSSKTIKITGTDRFGNAQSETIAMNGTTSVSSVYDYQTVKIVYSNQAMTGNISVGTNSTASSQWFCLSREMTPYIVGAAIQTGTGTTANLDYTYDDPNAVPVGYPNGTVEPGSQTPPVAWTAASPLNAVSATKAA